MLWDSTDHLLKSLKLHSMKRLMIISLLVKSWDNNRMRPPQEKFFCVSPPKSILQQSWPQKVRAKALTSGPLMFWQKLHTVVDLCWYRSVPKVGFCSPANNKTALRLYAEERFFV